MCVLTVHTGADLCVDWKSAAVAMIVVVVAMETLALCEEERRWPREETDEERGEKRERKWAELGTKRERELVSG